MGRIDQITGYLKKNLNLNDSDAAVVRYSLQTLFTSLVNIIAIISVSWLLGVLNYALYAAIAAAGLRVVSGGAHAAKLFNCSLLGAVVSPGIGLFVKYVWPALPGLLLPVTVMVTFAAALLVIWFYAPADTPAKPITRPEQRRNLRILSFVYIFLWAGTSFVILIRSVPLAESGLLAATLGILWQVFSITPAGYKLLKKIEVLLP